jgi:hypothetical protein
MAIGQKPDDRVGDVGDVGRSEPCHDRRNGLRQSRRPYERHRRTRPRVQHLAGTRRILHRYCHRDQYSRNCRLFWSSCNYVSHSHLTLPFCVSEAALDHSNGNAAPNIGRPLTDVSRVASSSMTSQCSAKTPFSRRTRDGSDATFCEHCPHFIGVEHALDRCLERTFAASHRMRARLYRDRFCGRPSGWRGTALANSSPTTPSPAAYHRTGRGAADYRQRTNRPSD